MTEENGTNAKRSTAHARIETWVNQRVVREDAVHSFMGGRASFALR